MSELYKRIQRLCFLNRGITVSAMCEEIGISKSTMSNLKNGKTSSLSPSVIQKIADYLDVSPSELLETEVDKVDSPPKLTDDIVRLVTYAMAISKNEKLALLMEEAEKLSDQQLNLVITLIRGFLSDGSDT